MTALTLRDGPTLVNELLARMGASTEPDIRIEEYAEGDRHVIRADLPGVDPDKDIRLEVDGSLLRLHGERRTEKHEEHRSEIRYGSFSRMVTLPPGTRAEDVTAEYTDGVLTVTMPSSRTDGARKIAITHGEPTE